MAAATDARMTTGDEIAVAERLLAQPSVPLLEERAVRAVLELAGGSSGLSARRDAAGNVVVDLDGPAAGDDLLVLVAHLDHPGFAVDEVVGDEARLAFRGGLAAGWARKGTGLIYHHPASPEPTGRGVLVEAADDGSGRLAAASGRTTDGQALPGGFATWDVPGPAVAGGRITAPACDDLAGAAAILAALRRLGTDGAAAPVRGLFTRAEEIGFLGTLEAIRLGTVPAGANVVSVECSAALPGAGQGEGVVIRVGDRTSIFDSRLSEGLRRAAREVAEAEPGFRYQRRLMDGGTCEASAFCAAALRASGLALPLGNYHNADDDGPGVAPEHVALDDYRSLVRLLVELGQTPATSLVADGPPEWWAARAHAARVALAGA